MSGYYFPPLMDSWSVFTSLPNISHQICLVFACVNEAQRWSSNQAFMLHKIKKNKFCQAIEWSRQQRLTQIKANSQKKGKKKNQVFSKSLKCQSGQAPEDSWSLYGSGLFMSSSLCPVLRKFTGAVVGAHVLWWLNCKTLMWCLLPFSSMLPKFSKHSHRVGVAKSHLAPGMKKPERIPILWLLRKLIYTEPCKTTRKLFKE